MIKTEKPFVGEFKKLLEAFVVQKRNLGYQYDTTRESLHRFSRFTLNYNIENKILGKQLVSDWTARRKNESVRCWKHRSSDLRQFALYLQNLGCAVFIPVRNHAVRNNEYIPYIFTQKEIGQLFQVIDSIKTRPQANKHNVYPLLFRLLYCCGLRISEAIHLRISDIDFDKGVLFIKKSKFNKDRIIPLSAPLTVMFVKYQTLFNKNNPPEDYYFRNKNGSSLSRDRVYQIYRKILWKAGISHGGKGKGPRLHDFRHTFCVHTLAKQAKAGIDLYVTLPILSTYVGHNSTRGTQRYVRLTQEAYPELIKKVSEICAYIFNGGKNETN